MTNLPLTTRVCDDTITELEHLHRQDQAKITELQLQLEKEKEATRNALADRDQVSKQLTKVREANEQLADALTETEKSRDRYHDAEITWEKEMMKAIGEDGVGSVSKAINAFKAQVNELRGMLDVLRSPVFKRKLQNSFRDKKLINACIDDAYSRTPEQSLNAVKVEAAAPAQLIIDYINEFGDATDLGVVKAELGEMMLRASGEYFEDQQLRGE